MQSHRAEPWLNSLVDAKSHAHRSLGSTADPTHRGLAYASSASSTPAAESIDVCQPFSTPGAPSGHPALTQVVCAAGRGGSPIGSSAHTPCRGEDGSRARPDITPAPRFGLPQRLTHSELSVSVDDASSAFSPRGSDFGEDDCDDEDGTWRRFFARPHRSKAASVTHSGGGGSVTSGDALSEVSPRLHIGSASLLTAPELLRAAKVHTVINCAEEGELDFTDPFLASAGMRPASESVVRVAMPDIDDFDSTEALEVAAEDLHELLSAGHAVAVCCRHGMNRSVSVVLAYMVKFKASSLKDAYIKVRQKRPVAYPNIGFWRTLQQLERAETGAASVPDSALLFHRNQDLLRHSLSLSQSAGPSVSRANSLGQCGSKAYAVSRSASVGGRAAPGSAPDVLAGHSLDRSALAFSGAGSGSGSGQGYHHEGKDSDDSGPGPGLGAQRGISSAGLGLAGGRRRQLPVPAHDGGTRLLFSDHPSRDTAASAAAAADSSRYGHGGSGVGLPHQDSRSSSGTGNGYYGPSGRSTASAPASALPSAEGSPVGSPRRIRHRDRDGLSAVRPGQPGPVPATASASSAPAPVAYAHGYAIAAAGSSCTSPRHGSDTLSRRPPASAEAVERAQAGRSLHAVPIMTASGGFDGFGNATNAFRSSGSDSKDCQDDRDDRSSGSPATVETAAVCSSASHSSAQSSAHVHAHALELHIHPTLACSSPRAGGATSEPLSMGSSWRGGSGSAQAGTGSSASIPAVRSPLSLHARTYAARRASGGGPMLAFSGQSSSASASLTSASTASEAGQTQPVSASLPVPACPTSTSASTIATAGGPHLQRGSHGGGSAGLGITTLSLPLSASAGAGPGGAISPAAGRMWPVGVLTVSGVASEPSESSSHAASVGGSGSARTAATRSPDPGHQQTASRSHGPGATDGLAVAVHLSDAPDRIQCGLGSCRSEAAVVAGTTSVAASSPLQQYDQSSLGHTGRGHHAGASPPFDVAHHAASGHQHLQDGYSLRAHGHCMHVGTSASGSISGSQREGHAWSGTGSIGELSTTPSSVARLSSRGLASRIGSSSCADSGGSTLVGTGTGHVEGFASAGTILNQRGSFLSAAASPPPSLAGSLTTPTTAGAHGGVQLAPVGPAPVVGELGDSNSESPRLHLHRHHDDSDALLTGRVTARSFEQASASPSLASPSYSLSASAPLPSAR